MNALKEALNRALAASDYQAALACLDQLPRRPSTASQAGEIAEMLRWALQTARVQRAHDATRLTEILRASAYDSAPHPLPHTWQMDA